MSLSAATKVPAPARTPLTRKEVKVGWARKGQGTEEGQNSLLTNCLPPAHPPHHHPRVPDPLGLGRGLSGWPRSSRASPRGEALLLPHRYSRN